MNTITFDSLTTARQLRERGVPQDQAEAIADAIRASKDTDFSHLATKEELSSFKSELKADLRELELRIDNKIGQVNTALADTKSEIRGWMLTGFIAVISLLSAVLFKLH
jgi:hypothetical protein